MAKMKSTPADDDLTVTYEKKGKRKGLSQATALSPAKGKGAAVYASPKGKGKALPRKKKALQVSSDYESDGNGDEDLEEETEDEEPRSPRLKRKKVASSAPVYDEVECRRQLNMLQQPSRRPPTAMSEDIFHTSCKLTRDGLNPHRLRLEKDVPKTDVETMFGEEKGRNGFLLAEKLTPSLRSEVESLYCQIYQRTQCPTHIGKELAMGWTLQTKGKSINWAGFAAETNLGQRQSYARRVKTWLTRLAEAQNKTFEEVAKVEVISKYLDVADEKKPCIRLFQSSEEKTANVTAAEQCTPVLRSTFLTDAHRVDRLAEVQELVNSLNESLNKLEADAEDLRTKADLASDQLRASAIGIQQVHETMKEMGEDTGSAIFKRLLEGHSKKSAELTASEADCKMALDNVIGKILGTQSRLTALEEHLQDLGRGGDGVMLHPHPLVNTTEALSGTALEEDKLQQPLCAACQEPFPHGDVLICSCKHTYHPWCAAQWFKTSCMCAHSHCGVVDAKWLKSWGFPASFNKAEVRGHDVDGNSMKKWPPIAKSGQQTGGPSALGLCSLAVGAPSMSASDSTFSKFVFKETTYAGHGALQHDEEKLPATPTGIIREGGGSSNPFDSKGSVVEANVKVACTNTPQSVPLLRKPTAKEVDAEKEGSKRGSEPHARGTEDVFLEKNRAPAAPAPNNASVAKKAVILVESPSKEVDVVDDFLQNYKKTATPLSELDKELMELDAKGAAFELMKPQASPLSSPSSVPEKPPEIEREDSQPSVEVEDPWDITILDVSDSKENSNDKEVPAALVCTNAGVAREEGTELADSAASPVKRGKKRPASGRGGGSASAKARNPAVPSKRQLRSKTPAVVTTSGGSPPSASAAGACSPHEGARSTIVRDLSGGLEAPPILFDDADAHSDKVPIHRACVYTRKPILHESVNVGALAAACSLHVCPFPTSETKCSDIEGTVKCDAIVGSAYVGNDALSEQFLAEFRRQRSLRNGRLVRCAGLPSCPEYEQGKCGGHVPRVYIRECYGVCACKPPCRNRVVQAGVQKQLQVFHASDTKGWGIRTLERLQRGCFVFEYGGEIVTNAELLTRGTGQKFAIALDAHWQSEVFEGDDKLLSIDASKYMNVARWLNHRCGDANLLDIQC